MKKTDQEQRIHHEGTKDTKENVQEDFRETDQVVCDKWNARYPVGTPFDVVGPAGDVRFTIITSCPAAVLGETLQPPAIYVRDEAGIAWDITDLRHGPDLTLKPVQFKPVAGTYAEQLRKTADDLESLGLRAEFAKALVDADSTDLFDDDDAPKRANYAATLLQDAIESISNRAASRDLPDGERSMRATVAAFNGLTGHELSEREGWVFMAVLKLARAQQGALNVDDYIDAPAYSALAGEAAIRETLVYPSGEAMPDGVKRLIARDTVRAANTQTQQAIDNDLAAHDDEQGDA